MVSASRGMTGAEEDLGIHDCIQVEVVAGWLTFELEKIGCDRRELALETGDEGGVFSLDSSAPLRVLLPVTGLLEATPVVPVFSPAIIPLGIRDALGRSFVINLKAEAV